MAGCKRPRRPEGSPAADAAMVSRRARDLALASCRSSLKLKEFARRFSREQPTIPARAHQFVLRQVSEYGRHGRAPRCDELGQYVVGERQRQDGSLWTYVTPPAGEMPEQHVHADAYARLLDDRQIHREVPRARERPRDEPPGQLRVPGKATGRCAIEHRQAGWLEHPPAGRMWKRRLPVLSLPGAQKVSVPQEFCAETTADPYPPDQQPVEHQQSDAVRHDVDLVPAPAAPANPHDSRDAFLDRLVPLTGGNCLGQVRVLV